MRKRIRRPIGFGFHVAMNCNCKKKRKKKVSFLFFLLPTTHQFWPLVSQKDFTVSKTHQSNYFCLCTCRETVCTLLGHILVGWTWLCCSKLSNMHFFSDHQRNNVNGNNGERNHLVWPHSPDPIEIWPQNAEHNSGYNEWWFLFMSTNMRQRTFQP